MKPKYDRATKAWFNSHICQQTTVCIYIPLWFYSNLKSQVPEELSQLMAYDEAIEIVKAGGKYVD